MPCYECPECGHVFIPCEVPECEKPATYEGWSHRRDFAGVLTGMMFKARVCEKHKTLLIGGQNGQEEAPRQTQEEDVEKDSGDAA